MSKPTNRDYQRNLTTNAYNQDFIYYKYSKDISKSPKFKKQPKHHQQIYDNNNHSKIQSMKNTLNTLFDPSNITVSKSFNKSVAEYDNRRKTQIPKNSKSVYEQTHSNSNFNNKLELLTNKLRLIAEKPHFSTIDELRKSKLKQSKKLNQDTYLANMSLIQKGSQSKNHVQFQQLLFLQNKKIIEDKKPNSKIGHNFSQQIAKSKIKFSESLFDHNLHEISNSNSKSSSMKRQIKGMKSEKSVTRFNFLEPQSIEFDISHRPRGKTFTNIINSPLTLEDNEQTKIKINSYIENKQHGKSILNEKIPYKKSTSKQKEHIQPSIVKILKPHRGPISSVIINSDGKRFLSASNDYTVKQSTLDGTYTMMRKHQGRVNIMRMIDDKLFTGGNDCRVKYEKQSFLFSSPVLEVYPHQRSYLNIGTSSTVELFDLNKRVSTKNIKIKTKFYILSQKINKQVYFLDNHSLSVIDWRVPFPLINLVQQQNFIDNWVSDPYTLDFYQVRNNKLIYTNNSKSGTQELLFEGHLRDYCWKKDKVYFLTDTQLKVFDNKRNVFVEKAQYYLADTIANPSKLHVKNNLWICGTRDGSLFVNRFE